MPDRRSPEVAEDDRTSPNGARPAAAGRDPGALSPQALQRAEELVDRMGERVAYYAAFLGAKIKEFAARLREEAEDIWAEAQSIRRGEQTPAEK